MPLNAPNIMRFRRRKNENLVVTSWSLEIKKSSRTLDGYHILFAKRVGDHLFVLCSADDNESLRSQQVYVPKDTKSGDRMKITKLSGHRIWVTPDPEEPARGTGRD